MSPTMCTQLSVLALAASSASAFAPAASSFSSVTRRTALRSSPQDEVARLRAAAAKAREEANQLAKELGKEEPVAAGGTAVATAEPKLSAEELQSLLPSLIAPENDDAAVQQAEQWAQLKASNTVQAFGQANLRTFPVSLQMLEQRTGLTSDSLGLENTKVGLDDFKFATLYVLGFSAVAGIASLALLPPNIGATLCYLFALLPVVFLGIGSSAPELIANAIASLKGEGGESVSPQERIVRHEAAHFCCGYWCGLYVSGYSVQDGVARVEFGVGRNDSGKFSQTQVAALAVTALAGLVGEATKWNKAEGAQGDLMQLEQVFRSSSEFIGAAQQQDITRWGAFSASNLLQTNKDKYEEVVEAFGRQASVEECIGILES